MAMFSFLQFLLMVVVVAGQDFRLPTHVTPFEYYVTVVLDDESFTFDGTVAIWFEVNEASRNITLHNRDLAVDEDLVELYVRKYGPAMRVTDCKS
jgi:hypothetical protein